MLPDYSAYISPPSPRARASLDALIAELGASGEDRRRWLEQSALPELLLNAHLDEYTGSCGTRVKLTPVVAGTMQPGKEAEAMQYAVERGYRGPKQEKRGGRLSPALAAFLRKLGWRTDTTIPEELFSLTWRIYARVEKPRPIPGGTRLRK